MLRTEGNGHRHTPSVQHSCGAPEGARSRKPRPVLCLGNRALNGRPTGDAEVGVARCPVTARLVGSDAVVDVAEAGGLHRKRSALIAGCAVECSHLRVPSKRSMTPLACADRTRVRRCRTTGTL